MMTNSYLYESWNKIVKQVMDSNEDPNKFAYKPFVKCEFGMTYISANKNRTKFLIIELNSIAAEKFEAPNVKGLIFETCKIPTINNDNVFLKIGASEEMDMEQAFESFAVSLVDKIKNVLNYYDVLEIVYEVVNKFSQFFGAGKRNALTSSEEQGLFGELSFLKDLISKYGEEYLKYWTGTEKNKHDFIFANNYGVEIKTTLSQGQKNITISNENQLNFEERKRLFLNVYVLEKNPIGKTFLEVAHEVDDLIYSLEYKKIFRKKLLEDGVSFTLTETKSRFNQISNSVYIVDKDFPRIVKPEISSRIFNVKYKLNIDGIETYKGDLLNDIRQ